MRTPDQVRLQLEQCAEVSESCAGCLQLIAVLHAVLPDLVKAAQPSRTITWDEVRSGRQVSTGTFISRP